MKIPDYVQVVENPYKSSSSKSRKGVMVGGPWVDELADFIEKNAIKAVYFNSSKGWTGEDYTFLSKLKGVEELDIIASSATGLTSVEQMDNLVELSISASCKEKIDFSKIRNLEKCYLYWMGGYEGIFDCSQLKSLYIDTPKLKDYSKISRLKTLEVLTIANSSIESVSLLLDLKSLKELELLNCRKLQDFSPIKECKDLRRLTIGGCKLLFELDFLANCKHLEVLLLVDDGEILSLTPLKELTALKALSLAGTVVKDGDFSAIASLPKLSMLMFQSKKHYTHNLIKSWDWNNFNNPSVLLEKR